MYSWNRRTLPAALTLTAIVAGLSAQDRADPNALRPLFDRCLQQLRSAAALAGERSERIESPGRQAEPADAVPFFVQQPGCWSRGTPEFETRSDGKVMWTIERLRHRYIRQEDFWTRTASSTAFRFFRSSSAAFSLAVPCRTPLPWHRADSLVQRTTTRRPTAHDA
ncbi:MAG TPA: hypothetical protein VK348_11225 [Planctomycetota bacterium]|nr:hypothetical protein [Planctomycetota bacterium]